MRFAENAVRDSRFAVRGRAVHRGLAVAVVLTSGLLLEAEGPQLIHQQRYAMGTMFDVVAYHASRPDGERAIASAMDEIARLDQVLSHYKADSDLARLLREARGTFARVDASLFDVLRESLVVSRASGGTFDVTIGPLLKLWRTAHDERRRPSAPAVAAAARCVGYEKIELEAPDRIRLHSDCLDIDLGGIGKGYAVDRAIAVLEAAGIRAALVNAGGSSIAAIGAPPNQRGWPVELRAHVSGRRILLLAGRSISTSQQRHAPAVVDGEAFGEIINPHAQAPTDSRIIVSVVAPSATISDALDTALVMMSIPAGKKMLAEFPGVSAIWGLPSGQLEAAYRGSDLQLADIH
jgi:FAD:protein FMN transferase